MSIEVESDGAVHVVTINRPKVRNAVDRDTAEALSAAFRTFDADPDAAVAVLKPAADDKVVAGLHAHLGADVEHEDVARSEELALRLVAMTDDMAERDVGV